MNNLRFILTCGMPGAGKSTYARMRQSLEVAEGRKCVIVNDDALVLMCHGGAYDAYDVALKPVYQAAAKAIIEQAFQCGASIILDRTCPDRSARERWRRVALEAGYTTHELVFFKPRYTAEEYALRRWKKDSRGLPYSRWRDVLVHMFSTYQDPRAVETWDYITTPPESLQ